MPQPLKVLFWDVETSPMAAFIWRPNDDYVASERLIHESFLFAWSAKWSHETKVHSAVLTGKEAIARNDKRIVEELADLVREADVIVAHNGVSFDTPVLNARLIHWGLDPVGYVKQIDTLKMSRKTFKFPYHKLDWLSQTLIGDQKLKTGWSLWEACYYGDEKALAKMSRYCSKDVRLLEEVFVAISPYVAGVPRLYDPSETGDGCCPHCGMPTLVRRGTVRTQTLSYGKYRCGSCGKYSKARKAEPESFSAAPL